MTAPICRRCGLNIFRCDCKIEDIFLPRASVMPPHLESVDPTFIDAAFRPFTPAEKVMVEEKELPHLLRAKGAL